MFWLILILLVVGAVLYAVMGPKYFISLQSGGDTYEDAFVKIKFGFKSPEDLRFLTQIAIALENKTTAPLKIDWDSSVFIDPAGTSNRIIHSGIKLIDRSNTQQTPTLVASRSKVEDLMVPTDNVYWQDGSGNKPGSWKYRPLLTKWKSQETIEFRVVLSLDMGSETKHYELEFVGKKKA